MSTPHRERMKSIRANTPMTRTVPEKAKTVDLREFLCRAGAKRLRKAMQAVRV